MKIWVDADACPNLVKEVLFRAANRTRTELILVANQPVRVPPSPYIRRVQVTAGFDVADDEIVQQATEGDLVITSDLPLASELIEKGVHVLTPRGEALTRDNIGARLNMRDFMETMRSSGVQSGGPPPLNKQDIKHFADTLDRFLARVGQ